jgi:excisionase family DNA binding protein
MSRRLLALSEVAALCGVSRATVRRLIAAGELPASRVGGQIRVERLDLDRYLVASRLERVARTGEHD